MKTPQKDGSAAIEDMPVRFLGRQPIVDQSGHLFGHELLFRAGHDASYFEDGDQATRDVIDHCLLLVSTSDDSLIFVNCTRSSIISGVVTLLPPATTVLEILEDVYPDAELLEKCVELRTMGYRFALDDFVLDEVRRPFLDIADFIKIDFQVSASEERRKIYEATRRQGVRFLAEKVETREQVEAAREEGCELFQGYFFARPETVATRAIPQSHLIYLQLLTELSAISPNLQAVERLVMSDASICVRLLRLANSAVYSHPHKITTIRGALLMVGEDEFRKMVSVAVASSQRTSCSPVLLRMALERAKFCELLAPLLNQVPSRLYLLGLFSLLDSLLEIPMIAIIGHLGLDLEMQDALLGRKGRLKGILDLARCHESANSDEFAETQFALGLATHTGAMFTKYQESVLWAAEMTALAVA